MTPGRIPARTLALMVTAACGEATSMRSPSRMPRRAASPVLISAQFSPRILRRIGLFCVVRLQCISNLLLMS